MTYDLFRRAKRAANSLSKSGPFELAFILLKTNSLIFKQSETAFSIRSSSRIPTAFTVQSIDTNRVH